MLLSIRIKKKRSAASVLTVKRSDGTQTHAKLEANFEIHDIAHYIVEKRMGFKNAFYGLLSQGHQINEFQLPKEERPKALWPQNMPQEALVTENLVNLLTIDFMQPEMKMDILKTLEAILKEKGLFFPERLDNEKIASMRNGLSDVMVRWNELNSGQELKLELRF